MKFEKMKSDLITEVSASVIEKLYLEKHRLVKINENAFNGFINLSEIYLSRNLLNNLSEKTFQNLSKLTVLDLSLNQLTKLNDLTFRDLSCLQKLDLSGNHIKQINEKTFEGLSNLSELYLSRNKLKTIGENSFKSMNLLKILYLFNNNLEELNEKVFEGLNSLEELDLSFNSLYSLKENTFDGLKRLKRLYLFINKLTSLPATLFHQLLNLQVLYLSRNYLTSLDVEAFKGLRKIRTLDLSHNQLKIIDKDLFKELKNLSELYLFANKIESVNTSIFLDFQNLNELCLFDQTVFYQPKIKIENYEINKANICLIFGKSFRNNSIGSEYTIKNNSLSLFRVEKCTNFHDNFEWSNILPRLNILTSSESCGKTTLLNLIYKSISQTSHKYLSCQYYKIEYYFNKEILKARLKEFDESLKLSINNIENFEVHLFDSIEYFCLIQYFDYLILRGYDFKELNKYLSKKKFKYKFSEKRFKERKNYQTTFLNDVFISKESYYGENLQLEIEYYLTNQTDGCKLKLADNEYFELLILLWQFHAQKLEQEHLSQNSKAIKNKLRILLLDHPDLFMNAKVTNQFTSFVLTNQIAHLNFQIIMSTHNGFTLNFVPRDHIFSIITKEDKIIGIKCLNSKQQLLSIISHSKKNHLINKIVLIENESLLKFLDMIKYYLTRRGFFSVEDDAEYNFLFLLFKLKNEQRKLVSHWLEKFLELDEASQFYCLVEKNAFELRKFKSSIEQTNIHRLSRCSFENYIYDPLNVFLYLFIKSRNELAMFDSFIRDLRVENVNDLFQMKREEMAKFIQIIVDHFASLFLNELKSYQSKLLESFNPNEKIQVKFVYNIENNLNDQNFFYILYPTAFIDLKGYLVKQVFLKLFPSLPPDSNTFIEFLRREIFENSKLTPDSFLCLANYFRFVPYELIHKFKMIQNKSIDCSDQTVKDDIVDFSIFNQKNILRAIDFLHEKINYINLININEMLSVINEFKSKLSLLFSIVISHTSRYVRKESELNKLIINAINERVTDFEKMDAIVEILDQHSNPVRLNENGPKLEFDSVKDVYTFFYDLGNKLEILSENNYEKKIEDQGLICEDIIQILKSMSLNLVELNRVRSIENINRSIQIQKMYAIIKNGSFDLSEKISKIREAVDYSMKYYDKSELDLISNENLMFNILNVFILLKQNETLEKNSSLITLFSKEAEATSSDNAYSFEYLLQEIVYKFNSKLEKFIGKFLRRISLKLNQKLGEFFNEKTGKLRTKVLAFKLIKTFDNEIDLIELEYPFILLVCSFSDLKFIYENMFECQIDDLTYRKLMHLNENLGKNFKQILYPTCLLEKFNFIDNEIDLLELFEKIKTNYLHKNDLQLFLNDQDVKRFLYNPINIFFYIYHKNSREKFDVKDFYKTVEAKIKIDIKDDLEFKTKIRIREVALNYIVEKFVNHRIVHQLQQFLNDEYIHENQKGCLSETKRKILRDITEKMRKLDLITSDHAIDTSKSTIVSIRINSEHVSKKAEDILEMKFKYPSLFVKLDAYDLKSIYEYIAPPYSFEPRNLISFLKNESNLNELILIHYCD